MPTSMAATPTRITVSAPQCPSWCKAHRGRTAGWTRSPYAGGEDLSKTCERRIPAGVDAYGTPVIVSLRRFACVDGHQVEIYPPNVNVETCDAPIDRANVLRFAAALATAAELMQEG